MQPTKYSVKDSWSIADFVRLYDILWLSGRLPTRVIKIGVIGENGRGIGIRPRVAVAIIRRFVVFVRPNHARWIPSGNPRRAITIVGL